MTGDPLHDFCRGLPRVTEDVKWGDNLVFSVGSKMFASFRLPDGEPFGFKVDPGSFDVLVQQEGILPAPYAARFHWVSVVGRDVLPTDVVRDLIERSHELVSAGLSRKMRRELGLG